MPTRRYGVLFLIVAILAMFAYSAFINLQHDSQTSGQQRFHD